MIARKYQVRPSEILGLSGPVVTEDWDPYTAYCLDEALMYVESELEAGKEPTFNEKVTSLKGFFKSITEAP